MSLVKKGIETPKMTIIEESEVNNEFATPVIEDVDEEEVYDHLPADDTNDSKQMPHIAPLRFFSNRDLTKNNSALGKPVSIRLPDMSRDKNG